MGRRLAAEQSGVSPPDTRGTHPKPRAAVTRGVFPAEATGGAPRARRPLAVLTSPWPHAHRDTGAPRRSSEPPN